MVIQVLIIFLLVLLFITHSIFLILDLLVVRLHLELGEVGVPIEPAFRARIVIAVHVAFALRVAAHLLHHILQLVGSLEVGIAFCHPVRLRVIAFDQFLSLDGTAGDPECIIDLSLAQPSIGTILTEIKLCGLGSIRFLLVIVGRRLRRMLALIAANDFDVLQAERLIHSKGSATHRKNLVSLRA